jgi:hypothetical protein
MMLVFGFAANLVGGCAPAAVALPVAGVPWPDGETATYAWVEAGAELGTGVFSQRRVEGGWELRNTAVLGFYEHVGVVVVDPATVLPLRSEVKVSGVPVSYEVVAEYGAGASGGVAGGAGAGGAVAGGVAAGKVELTAKTAQGDRGISLKLPAGHYVDNDQLLATIRCLPLREGFKMSINVVNTVGGVSLPVQVAVEAIEQVQMPGPVVGLEGMGTTFEAYRVALLGGQQRAWYTVAAPHIMVRYNNGQRVCELREYSPGSR